MATLSFNPFIIGILRNAQVILARTKDTAKLIPDRYASKVRVMLETAMVDELLASPVRPDTDESNNALRVIYTGRLVAFKNFSAALNAIARAKDKGLNLHFVVVGDGPLRSSLEALSRKLGIAEQVEFRGPLSHDEVFVALRNSDVYLFPSLREGGVWSLMEAMSIGLPTICVNTSGMEVITDDTSAIRIEPASQQQMIEDFAQALGQLARSPSQRRQLGDNARKRIEEHFLWRHKGDFMISLFEELEKTA